MDIPQSFATDSVSGVAGRLAARDRGSHNTQKHGPQVAPLNGFCSTSPVVVQGASVAVMSSERNIDAEHAEFGNLESGKNGGFHENRNQCEKGNGPMEYNTGLSANNVVVC